MRDAARGGHDQRPRQLGGCGWRTNPFRDGNTALGAGGDVDVFADFARLCDQFELGQFFNQLARQMRAFAVEHDHVSIFEANRQLANASDGIGVNLGRIGV